FAKEARFAVDHADLGMPVLAPRCRPHLAPKLMGDVLKAIAYPQNGQSHGEYALIRDRSILIIDRGRASAQNDPGRTIGFDLIKRSCTWENRGEDFQLAHATRNQLGILRAKVKNDNRLVFHEQFSLIRRNV